MRLLPGFFLLTLTFTTTVLGQDFVYDTAASWSSDGQTITYYTYRYDSDGAELHRLRVDGSSDERLTDTYYNEWWLDVSADGSWIVFSSDKGRDERFAGGSIFRLDVASGKVVQLTETTGEGVFDTQPEISPDGTRIVYGADQIATKENAEIMVVSVEGGEAINLTNHPARDLSPTWTPDGKAIIFASDRDGAMNLYRMEADGSHVKQITDTEASDIQPTVSPDGTRIAFVSDRDGDRELYIMNADGTEVRQLTQNDVADVLPDWSPDGSRIAYSSYRRGDLKTGDIVVINVDGSGDRIITAK